MTTPPPARLERRLPLTDAVVIGAGSMVGAGVFAAWAPAAEAAGAALLVALVLAGAVAYCNATSSAALAALHPESGGTYVYARHRLGPAWGHLAGWAFVVGKTASCAAMALTVGAYLWPDAERLVAVVAVLAITAVNLMGITRTAAVTRVLLAIALVALLAVLVAGWSSGEVEPSRIRVDDADPYGVLQAAGLLFFAFAGYARIATLGEEVMDPAVTIPKAIPRALGGVLLLYGLVGVTALLVVGPAALAATDAPLREVVAAGRWSFLGPVVRIGAGIAALGVLLNLLAGISRTALAMGRRRELPPLFADVWERHGVPAKAELVVATAVVLLVAVLDLRNAIAVSGVAVLTYYALTNASAWVLPASQRLWPSWLAGAGFVGCVVLAASLPVAALVGGVVALAVGVAVRAVQLRVWG